MIERNKLQMTQIQILLLRFNPRKFYRRSRQLSQFWTADILLKYPTFEGVFSHFHGQNQKCIVFRLKCGSMELFYSLLDSTH